MADHRRWGRLEKVRPEHGCKTNDVCISYSNDCRWELYIDWFDAVTIKFCPFCGAALENSPEFDDVMAGVLEGRDEMYSTSYIRSKEG
jgi:hypothetical protein